MIKMKFQKVVISALLLLLGVISAEATGGCTVNNIALDDPTVLGTWTSDCISTNRSDSYAQFYTFDLAQNETVQIDLKSTEDTYLYLLQDNGTSGIVIDSNDDFGGSLNSRIIKELDVGSYTIEATTYSEAVTGDFNLTLKTSSYESNILNGDMIPTESMASLLETCTGDECPLVVIDAYVNFANGEYIDVWEEAIYNPTTQKYEYSLNILAENGTAAELYLMVYIAFPDPDAEEYTMYYSFGDDQAVGGGGANEDHMIDYSACPYMEDTFPLVMNFDGDPLPFIPMDLSTYVLPAISQARMTVKDVPSNVDLYMNGYNIECQNWNWNSYSMGNPDGSVTLVTRGLIEGKEYGFGLQVYSSTMWREYALNDNDNDFSNGGVFVEDMIYDENYMPIFDKTIFATSEDIEISAPENLGFGNPIPPILYLLLL